MRPADAIERRVVHYNGRVQGVGFRQTTCSVAGDYAVTGFVQNLDDGRVLLVAEGKRDVLEAFLAAVDQALSRFIVTADRRHGPASGEYSNFRICY